MSSTVLLAVDVVAGKPRADSFAAAQLARGLVRDSADHVVVLYVREFSIRRIGRMVADHGGTVGQRAVNEIVAGLRDAGIQASGLVREADGGHVGQVIAEAARDLDARVIVIGSGRHVSWPHIPLGSVAMRVLHLAMVPVLVVPAPERRAGTAIPVPLATAAAEPAGRPGGSDQPGRSVPTRRAGAGRVQAPAPAPPSPLPRQPARQWNENENRDRESAGRPAADRPGQCGSGGRSCP